MESNNKKISSDKLIGLWTLNGDLKDYSGYGYDATFVGEQYYTTSNFGRGYVFDGIKNGLIFGSSNEMLENKNEWTQCFWFKQEHGNSITEDKWMLQTKRGTTPADGSATKIQFKSTDNRLHFVYRATSTNWGTDIVGPSLSILSNDWHHIAITYDGITFKMYLDGDLYNFKEDINFTGFGSGNIVFGYNNYSLSNYFCGISEEIMIFSRVLSLDEVKSIYKKDREMICNTAYVRYKKNTAYVEDNLCVKGNATIYGNLDILDNLYFNGNPIELFPCGINTTFKTIDGKTVTVINGIIVSVTD